MHLVQILGAGAFARLRPALARTLVLDQCEAAKLKPKSVLLVLIFFPMSGQCEPEFPTSIGRKRTALEAQAIPRRTDHLRAKQLTSENRSHGYLRLHAMLRRESLAVNLKRTFWPNTAHWHTARQFQKPSLDGPKAGQALTIELDRSSGADHGDAGN